MMSPQICFRCLAPLLVLLHLGGAATAVAGGTPVLLSLDVEQEGDGAALETLGLEVPATYFFTGRFVEKHPQLVAELARENTVGSHSYSHAHLTTLDREAARLDLAMTRVLLERATGEEPLWFRAPYGEHDDQVMAAAVELGFRYDSSDWERWQRQRRIPELPVSMGADGLVASDYGLVFEREMSDAQLLSWLQRSYREKAVTGRPFVVLFHPSIIAPRAAAVADFVAFVERQEGVFLTFDQYLEAAFAPRPERFATWVDWSLEGFGWGRHDPQQIAADAAGAGLTDVFVMIRDPEGLRHDGGERFAATVELLRRQGQRVHAWIPLYLDVAAAREHPEWAMVAQDGTPSEEWLSPHHPEVQERLLATVAEVLERHEVDGVHLDYLRYPSLDYDFSPRALAAFAGDAGLTLGESPAIEILERHYEPWTDWRARQMAATVSAVRQLVQEKAPGVVLSAALIAEAAISYREWEKYGQDYALLAEHLDLLVPMAYHKLNQRPPGWIADVVLGARHKAGRTPVWIGVDAWRQPEEWPDYPAAELEEVLRSAVVGTDGVAAYPYLTLFGRGEETRNMPAGAGELFADAAAGRLNPRPAGGSALWDGLGERPLLALGLALPLVLALTFAARRSPLAIRRRRAGRGRAEVDEWRRLAGGWRRLATDVGAGTPSAELLRRVAELLRAIGSARLQRYRTAFVLDQIADGGGGLGALHARLDEIPGWKTLGLRYLQEACLLGLAELDGGAVTLTDAGREELERARAEGYGYELWRFVEQRLHEVLIVACPACGARSSRHWFWPDLECERCGREIAADEWPEVEVAPAAVTALSYTTT